MGTRQLEGTKLIMEPHDINNRFAYHRPATQEVADTHTLIREELRGVAHFLDSRIPEGREKAVAITKLEEVMFWANAAIARNQEV
jgi:hypothetical protein